MSRDQLILQWGEKGWMKSVEKHDKFQKALYDKNRTCTGPWDMATPKEYVRHVTQPCQTRQRAIIANAQVASVVVGIFEMDDPFTDRPRQMMYSIET